MEKKRSKGVTAFGALFLGMALVWTYTAMLRYITYNTHQLPPLRLAPDIVYSVVFVSLAFLTSVGLFTLKEWGRKLALFLGTYHLLHVMYRAIKDLYYMHTHEIQISTLIILMIIYLVFTTVPMFLLWWFFTRPKVKEQFR